MVKYFINNRFVDLLWFYQFDLDNTRIDDCVDRLYGNTNKTSEKSLCDDGLGPNITYMHHMLENISIVYGNEDATEKACGMKETTHFPEVNHEIELVSRINTNLSSTSPTACSWSWSRARCTRWWSAPSRPSTWSFSALHIWPSSTTSAGTCLTIRISCSRHMTGRGTVTSPPSCFQRKFKSLILIPFAL